MTDQENRQQIADYLTGHNTVTLATCSELGPWASAVFYVSDANFTMYFKSDPKTRHVQDILDNHVVAGTVQSDGQVWQSLCGLQLFGSCSRVDDRDTSRVDGLYMQKFPFLRTITDHSEDEHERILAERLRKTPFYQFCPRWIRLIDNARGFGHKLEVRQNT